MPACNLVVYMLLYLWQTHFFPFLAEALVTNARARQPEVKSAHLVTTAVGEPKGLLYLLTAINLHFVAIVAFAHGTIALTGRCQPAQALRPAETSTA